MGKCEKDEDKNHKIHGKINIIKKMPKIYLRKER